MKNHNKYAKLPQDLDLSFHNDLDLLPDTAADIDLEIDANDSDVAALNLNASPALDHDEETIISTRGGGLRLAPTKEDAEAVAPHRQQLEQLQLLAKRKICGLGSDSVVEVSLFSSKLIRLLALWRLQLVAGWDSVFTKTYPAKSKECEQQQSKTKGQQAAKKKAMRVGTERRRKNR